MPRTWRGQWRKTEPTESKVVRRAKLAMQPSVNAALVIAEFGFSGI